MNLSASFDKLRAAFGTSYCNLTLAPRYSDFLPAIRTFIDMMRLSLAHHIFLRTDKSPDFYSMLYKCLIFCIPFAIILRKHPEICIYQKGNRNPINSPPPHKKGENHQRQ